MKGGARMGTSDGREAPPGVWSMEEWAALEERTRSRALAAARPGIALRLTNFLRDVDEDRMRGRVYIPLDALRAEGIDALEARDPRQRLRCRASSDGSQASPRTITRAPGPRSMPSHLIAASPRSPASRSTAVWTSASPQAVLTATQSHATASRCI